MDKDINKLQEEIFKADIRKVEKMWKAMDENLSLEYHLDRMTKDELVKIAGKYHVRGITTLKKADAVIKVKESIISNIDIVLNLLDIDAVEFLEELISLGGTKEYSCSELINANYFRNRGLMFTGMLDGKLNIILPEDIYNLVNEKLNEELREKAKRNTEIQKIFAGMIYYYGVLTFDKFKELIVEHIDCNLENIDIETLILDGEELGFDYQIENEMAYDIDVDNPEEILKSQENNIEINYIKLDKKSLIKASKPDFNEENKQGAKLEKVIGELFVIDKKILKEEIESFSISIKNLVPIEDAIETFLEAYEIESDYEKNIFIAELEKLAKSIKQWGLKGHTEAEIENKKKTVIAEEKIGRNDPCPCGSNKKYKKCCGK